MSNTVGGDEFHPSQHLPVPQLLQAARDRLQDVLSGERCVYQTVATTHETIQTQILQDYDNPKPERSEIKKYNPVLAQWLTCVCIFRTRLNKARWRWSL